MGFKQPGASEYKIQITLVYEWITMVFKGRPLATGGLLNVKKIRGIDALLESHYLSR